MPQRLNIIFTGVLLFAFCFSYGQIKPLEEQARMFIIKLKSNNDYPTGGKDTVMDLNGDNLKDILIEFYAFAGTGEKNGVRVYLYDKSRKKFTECEQLNYLANPTFYREKKIVVGYYLGNGGGSATKLKWHGLKLDTLEHIEIDVLSKRTGISFKLTTSDHITKKKTTKTLNILQLPIEYKYMEYEPIIKTGSR